MDAGTSRGQMWPWKGPNLKIKGSSLKQLIWQCPNMWEWDLKLFEAIIVIGFSSGQPDSNLPIPIYTRYRSPSDLQGHIRHIGLRVNFPFKNFKTYTASRKCTFNFCCKKPLWILDDSRLPSLNAPEFLPMFDGSLSCFHILPIASHTSGSLQMSMSIWHFGNHCCTAVQ